MELSTEEKDVVGRFVDEPGFADFWKKIQDITEIHSSILASNFPSSFIFEWRGGEEGLDMIFSGVHSSHEVFVVCFFDGGRQTYLTVGLAKGRLEKFSSEDQRTICRYVVDYWLEMDSSRAVSEGMAADPDFKRIANMGHSRDTR